MILAYALSLPGCCDVTTTTLPNGQVNSPYTAILQASDWGCSDVGVWSLTSGGLPPGLTLSLDGRLSGTPLVAGTFDFSVTLSSGAENATKALTIVVLP